MQLESHHWSLTADETAWQSCTTGAEKPLAEQTRKADANVALICAFRCADTARLLRRQRTSGPAQ